MTRTQAEIVALFQKLPDSERREIVDHLREQIAPGDYYGQMSPAERAVLGEGIAEADRGETLTPGEIRTYMAKRFDIQQP